jgi:hypothetical protein
MLIAQSTIKPLHSYFPHTCWVRQVLTLAINNVAQKEEAAMKMLLVLGVCNPQSTACDVLEPSFLGFKRNTLIIFLFLYVILFLYSLICHYMHETWSWHAYRFALGFLWKNRCDTHFWQGQMVHLWNQSWSGPLLSFHIDLSLCHLQLVLPIGKETEGC